MNQRCGCEMKLHQVIEESMNKCQYNLNRKRFFYVTKNLDATKETGIFDTQKVVKKSFSIIKTQKKTDKKAFAAWIIKNQCLIYFKFLKIGQYTTEK